MDYSVLQKGGNDYMADTTPVKGLKFAHFPEANHNEQHVAAILVTKDDDGKLHTYVKDIPGRNQPNPEIVAMLAQAVEIANL